MFEDVSELWRKYEIYKSSRTIKDMQVCEDSKVPLSFITDRLECWLTINCACPVLW